MHGSGITDLPFSPTRVTLVWVEAAESAELETQVPALAQPGHVTQEHSFLGTPLLAGGHSEHWTVPWRVRGKSSLRVNEQSIQPGLCGPFSLQLSCRIPFILLLFHEAFLSRMFFSPNSFVLGPSLAS